ncbi:hypothetical protein B0H12DRAFT_230816 [Mycena haematopus]|nr:hypothetical protein B0H12DRAFT_230816 [Mycena haematopus]
MPMLVPPTQPDSHNSHQYQPEAQSQQYSQYPPQSQYQAPFQHVPQGQSPYTSPIPEPYLPQSQAQHEYQPQDPFAYVQPHDMAMQRVMAEQRAVEAEYAPPAAWIVDEKGMPQPHFQPTAQPIQPYQNHSPPQAESQHTPRDARTLAYQRPHDTNLERVMEKHRATEAEYAHAYANAQPTGTPTPAAWPDEKRGGGAQATLDVRRNPSSPRGAPTRTPSPAASWGAGSVPDTYPPSPGSASAGSSSAHGEAALSTIAAEMAALREQVARLEGERREELPPAYT